MTTPKKKPTNRPAGESSDTPPPKIIFVPTNGKGESTLVVNTETKKIVCECPGWAEAISMAAMLNKDAARVVDDPKKPTKPISGGKHLIASGKKPIMIACSPEQHELIRSAAATDERPMTQFVLRAAMEAAKAILEKEQP